MLKFIKKFFLLIILIECIKADCNIEIKGDHPVISQNFGSKKIIQLFQSNYITLKNDETISIKCSNQLWIKSHYSGDILNMKERRIRALDISCKANKYVYQFTGQYEYQAYDNSRQHFLFCYNDRESIALYESLKYLPYCEEGMSYAIGSNYSENVNIVKVGLCYDFDTMFLKYVTYLPYKSNLIIFNENTTEIGIKSVKLSLKLNYFKELFQFMDEEILNNSIQNIHNANNLMIVNQYKLDNIIQDNHLVILTQAFDSIFNIIWWTNLKTGNWRYFEKELKKQILLNNLYEVYSGTSDIVEIPSSSICNQTDELTFEYKNRLISIPKYIWSYLKPLNNNSLEFVIIGYNTPYISISNDKLICNDYCNQIDWLIGSSFEKMHLMPTHGVVVCCTPEEAALVLDNLPYEMKKNDDIDGN